MAKKFSDEELATRLQHSANLIDQQIDGWEDFSLSGRPSGLALYLEAGGEVDDSIRQILIDILRHGAKKNTAGGRNLSRDYQVFFIVDSISRSLKITKTAACREYARRTNKELRAVEMQYQRGSKI